MAKYDANRTKTLNARESIRENIGMYIGDASSHGLHQLFIEGIANSIDEAVGGYGKVIEIGEAKEVCEHYIKTIVGEE